jgi:ribose 5-phosphate isomerase B
MPTTPTLSRRAYSRWKYIVGILHRSARGLKDLDSATGRVYRDRHPKPGVSMDKSRPIWIGNDHGGLDMKRDFAKRLQEKGYPVHDVGTDSSDIVPYPYFAAEVAGAVARGEAERGILICSTGIGMSIIANRFKGVRASHCTSTYQARMTRAHNDSNILCLGGRITGIFEALDMLDVWLETPYEGGRHDISLGLIAEAEEAIGSPGVWVPRRPRR